MSVFFVRSGKLIGREHYRLKTSREEDKREILGAFVRQFYTGTAEIPKEICLEQEISDEALTDDVSWLKFCKAVRYSSLLFSVLQSTMLS